MEKFYISFSGETLPGCDPDAAKQGLANFFKLDPGVNLDTFFTGEKYILKRNLERDTARGCHRGTYPEAQETVPRGKPPAPRKENPGSGKTAGRWAGRQARGSTGQNTPAPGQAPPTRHQAGQTRLPKKRQGQGARRIAGYRAPGNSAHRAPHQADCPTG